jgi:hypothetical protein
MGAAGRAWFPVFFIMAAWAYRYGFCASGRGKREGKNSGKNFQKSSSTLSLHSQGRRRTVPFKTALFQVFFFLRKEKCNLKEPKNEF